MTERLPFHFSLSCIGEGNGNPLQCSFLENPKDGGAWWLPYVGSHRVGHNWSDLAAAAVINERKVKDSNQILAYSFQTKVQFSSVLTCVWFFANPWTTACQASLYITNSWSLPRLMSIESVMPSNHLILCHPLLPLPSIFPSIRVFSNEPVLLSRWPKYWSVSFNISPSNEYSGLISYRTDWLDLLAVQGTLQHHSSKASILWCSAFFIVQLSHPYVTTGKTIALTRWTFVGKVMSLLFNMLSRFVIAFLPRSSIF